MNDNSNIYIYGDVNYKPHLASFYKYLSGTNFRSINEEKIKELYDEANELAKIFSNKAYFFTRTAKLVKIINKIKTRPNKKDCDMKAESAILFILLVDPTFEATKIYGECNNTTEIKDKMTNYFGYFDKNLVKLEKMYIKKFLSKEQKIEIDEEIEERVFK